MRQIFGVLAGIAAVLFLFMFWSSATIIGPGERGVVIHWGKVTGKVLDPGFHFIAPISENVWVVDVRVQKEEVEATAASQDLQEVHSVLAINYHVDPDQVNWIYTELGPEFKERIIDPSVQESFKAVTALYPAGELITKRPEVKDKAKQILIDRLHKNNIIVDDLSIINFNFSANFNSAIEKKVTAEQDALAAKNKLEQIKFEAEQRISQAKGEAEAIRIQAQAIQQQGGADYVKLQAISKWDGKLPNYMLGDSVPLIQLGN